MKQLTVFHPFRNLDFRFSHALEFDAEPQRNFDRYVWSKRSIVSLYAMKPNRAEIRTKMYDDDAGMQNRTTYGDKHQDFFVEVRYDLPANGFELWLHMAESFSDFNRHYKMR